MTFSYSRLSAFDSCRYKWLMKYIFGIAKLEDGFFSSYGTFMHDILAKFYRGEGDADALVSYYLENYFAQVTGKPQKNSTAINYFNAGLDMVSNLQPTDKEILGVEKEVYWTLDGREYIGYIDLILRDKDGIIIRDHKNRDLKPRSNRKKPTKSDEELDSYLRQLYLYAIPIKELYGEYPVSLEFNCFRTQDQIKEPFKMDNFEKTKQWSIDKADEIEKTDYWNPTIDYFGCKYLCDIKRECEYYWGAN